MDYMAFGFTILGVIVAAFVLQHFGYINHSVSPAKGASGNSRAHGAYGATPHRTPEIRQRFEI